MGPRQGQEHEAAWGRTPRAAETMGDPWGQKQAIWAEGAPELLPMSLKESGWGPQVLDLRKTKHRGIRKETSLHRVRAAGAGCCAGGWCSSTCHYLSGNFGLK